MTAFSTTFYGDMASMLCKEFGLKMEGDKKTVQAEVTLEYKPVEGRSKVIVTIWVDKFKEVKTE